MLSLEQSKELKEFKDWLHSKDKYSDNWIERAVEKYRLGMIEHRNEPELTKEQCLDEREKEKYDELGYTFKLTLL